MKTCCEVMQEVLDTSDGPFFYPTRLFMRSGPMKLATRMYSHIHGYEFRERRYGWIFISYCPFCGENLEKGGDQD